MLAVKHQATQDNRSAKQQWWTVFRSRHANFMPKLQALPTHTQYHNKKQHQNTVLLLLYDRYS